MAIKYSGVRESKPDRFTDFTMDSKEAEGKFASGQMPCARGANRTFETSIQCQEINSMSCLMTLNDAVFVVHSPLGCVGCTSMAVEWYRVGQARRGVKVIKDPRIIVTNLDSKSVVFGGEAKLREAVHKAIDRYSPKMIFVFSSCACAIIGDDLDAITDSLQEETGVPVIPIHCEGFKSRLFASGYDAAFMAIQKKLLPKEKPEKIDNLINLFAPVTVSYTDQIEMTRMLNAIGLDVNYFPYYSSLEGIERVPKAIASTSICKVFADEFMKQLEDQYDIPYSHTVMPVGVRNTDTWFRGVAKVTGKEKEVEEIIAREHERIEPKIREIRKRLEGKTACVEGGVGRSFAAAVLAEDFGMKLIGINTAAYDTSVQKDVEYLNENNHYQVMVSGQYFEVVNMIGKLKPDVFLGFTSYAVYFGIPTSNVLDAKRSTMGYDGLLYLGMKIAEQLENPGFNKKFAENWKSPFKDSWLADDPYKFLERGDV